MAGLARLPEIRAPQTLAERRAGTDQWRAQAAAEARKLFPVNVEEEIMGGVRSDVTAPLDTPNRIARARSSIFTRRIQF